MNSEKEREKEKERERDRGRERERKRGRERGGVEGFRRKLMVEKNKLPEIRGFEVKCS